MQGSSASEIQKDLISPRYLTLDIPKEKLYWLDGDRVYSVKFDGTEKNVRIFILDGNDWVCTAGSI